MPRRTSRRGRAMGLARALALAGLLVVPACAPRSTAPPGYPASAPPSAQPASGDAEVEESSTSDATARTFGWFSLAVGADAAAVAIATSALTLGYKSTRGSDCDAAKVCSANGLNANGEIAGLVGWNVGAYVLAALGLGAGAVLLLTHPADRGDHAAVAVTPSVGLSGLGLSGSF